MAMQSLLPAFSPNFIMYCLGLATYIEPMFNNVSNKPNLTISAIVPAFNEERTISRTLESLLHQSERLWRIIVVDDGSDDRTSEIARSFRDVYILKNPQRMGKAESINRALRLIDSDLVLIVDADTVLEKSFSEKAVRAFIEEDVAAANGFIIPSNESMNVAIRKARVVENLYSQTTLKKGQNMVNGLFVISGCCAIFRTHILKRIGIPTETVTEDLDITWILEMEGYRTALIDAYAKTLEPKGIEEYVAQIKRWYMGFFQCLSKHGFNIFVSKPLAITLILILIECLVFTLFWAAAIGLAVISPLLRDELLFLKWFLLTMFFVDILTVCFPASYKAHKSGILKDFISGLPVYYFFRVINVFFWWITFVEWLFGLSTKWQKTR